MPNGNGYRIADIGLAEQGRDRLDWVRYHMPIMRSIKERFEVERPLAGVRIAISMPFEAKTGVWVETLIAGGAEVAIAGNPPGTTQDEVAAHLVKEYGVRAFSWRSETYDDLLDNSRLLLDTQPDIFVDNGAILHGLLYEDDTYKDLRNTLIGATEETTTGANRLRESLPTRDFPTVIINDTMTKRVVENCYGVGISVVDGLMRTTNIMLGGKRVAVIGYGYCGEGIAARLRGLGAHVTVVDKDPLLQIGAHLEGFPTAAIGEAVADADIVLTVTGREGVISRELLTAMKNGAILCNAGYSEFEIDMVSLDEMAASRSVVRPNIELIRTAAGKEFFLLARGNPINLAAADGNPVEVMDIGLCLQTLSLEHIALHAETLARGPQTVPAEVEQAVLAGAIDAWIDS